MGIDKIENDTSKEIYEYDYMIKEEVRNRAYGGVRQGSYGQPHIFKSKRQREKKSRQYVQKI